MNHDDLSQLDALRAAATPTPYIEQLDESYSHILGVREDDAVIDVAHVGSTRADAAFIVAACNAVGPLIERAREAERERDAERKRAEEWRARCVEAEKPLQALRDWLRPRPLG